jgi:NodT family efflux transporter outer membrane factor (OMF) lipoprotein
VRAAAVRRALAGFAAAATLSACTVGPDYQVPDNALVRDPSAQKPFQSGGARDHSDGSLPPHWWRLYDDARLDGLIGEALAANTNLRMANANLERSLAQLRETRTFQQVSIPVDGGVAYEQVAGEQYLLPVRPPVNTDYETEFTVGYDLDLFGGIRRGIEAAKANSDAAVAARDLVRVNVVAETARAYADACGFGLELRNLERILDLQRSGLALTQKLKRGGRAIDLDLVQARQAIDQTAESVPSLQAGQRNALLRLATLTGRTPAGYGRDLESCVAPPRLTQPLPAGDGAALLKRRPDVRQAERQLAAATASIGVATAQLYPDISIGLSAGSLGAASDGFTSPTNFWSIGTQVRWQANQSAARARIAQAQASTRLSLAAFDAAVLRALQDAESAINVYAHDLEREKKAEAVRGGYARQLADQRRLRSGGRATSLSVVQAQRALASAELSLAQIQAAISGDQINVFLALGGGWEPDSSIAHR